VSNSSVFNIRAKVLKSLQDLQLNENEFQTAGALTLTQISYVGTKSFGLSCNDAQDNNHCGKCYLSTIG